MRISPVDDASTESSSPHLVKHASRPPPLAAADLQLKTKPRRLRLLILLALGLVAAVAASILWSRRDSDPDRLFERARAEVASGQSERAAETVKRLASLRKPSPFDRLLRAQVAEARQRPEEALAELAFINDNHPLAPIARSLHGKIELKRARLRSAESAFLQAIALSPDSLGLRRDLVYIYNLQHRQIELDTLLHSLSERETLDFQYLLHWGKTRNVVWNPNRDCEALAKCVEADPDDRRSRLALAEGFRRLNRLDDAANTLAPLADSDPEARAQRVMLELERNDPDKAQQILQGADPEDPALAYVRGRVALARGDGPAAVRYFRSALKTAPNDRAVLFSLGAALKFNGDPAAAEPYLNAAQRHDAITPLITIASTAAGANDPTIPARLAAACEAAGRLYESRAWYKLAISRDPLDQKSQQGFFRLGQQIEKAADRPK